MKRSRQTSILNYSYSVDRKDRFKTSLIDNDSLRSKFLGRNVNIETNIENKSNKKPFVRKKQDPNTKTGYFNGSKVTALGGDQGVTINENGGSEAVSDKFQLKLKSLSNAYFIFTDGSCLKNVNVEKEICPAGWSSAIVQINPNKLAQAFPNRKEDDTIDLLSDDMNRVLHNKEFSILREELYGPVILDPRDPLFFGARYGSNNTGELSAFGEAFIWCREFLLNYLSRMLAQRNNSRESNSKKVANVKTSINRILGRDTNISRLRMAELKKEEEDNQKENVYLIFKYDSEYAAKSVTGEFNGKKNPELIARIREELARLKAFRTPYFNLYVVFSHVKAHTAQNHWNNYADELAKRGSQGGCSQAGRLKNHHVSDLPVYLDHSEKNRYSAHFEDDEVEEERTFQSSSNYFREEELDMIEEDLIELSDDVDDEDFDALDLFKRLVK